MNGGRDGPHSIERTARIRCSTGPSQSVFFLHFLVFCIYGISQFSRTLLRALSLALPFLRFTLCSESFFTSNTQTMCVCVFISIGITPMATFHSRKNGQNVIIVGEYRVFNPNIYPPRTRSTPGHNNNSSNGTVFPHTRAPCGPYAQQTGV